MARYWGCSAERAGGAAAKRLFPVKQLLVRFAFKLHAALGMLAVKAETELKAVRAIAGIRRLTFEKISVDMPNPARAWIREFTRGIHQKTPLSHDPVCLERFYHTLVCSNRRLRTVVSSLPVRLPLSYKKLTTTAVVIIKFLSPPNYNYLIIIGCGAFKNCGTVVKLH